MFFSHVPLLLSGAFCAAATHVSGPTSLRSPCRCGRRDLGQGGWAMKNRPRERSKRPRKEPTKCAECGIVFISTCRNVQILRQFCRISTGSTWSKANREDRNMVGAAICAMRMPGVALNHARQSKQKSR